MPQPGPTVVMSTTNANHEGVARFREAFTLIANTVSVQVERQPTGIQAEGPMEGSLQVVQGATGPDPLQTAQTTRGKP